MDINTDTHVLTLTTKDSTTLTIQLTTGADSQLAQLEDTDSKHYIHYSSKLVTDATTDAEIVVPDRQPRSISP